MNAETGAPDAWETVIADLRGQRDKIDQAIQLLQTIRSANAALAGLPAVVVSQNDSAQPKPSSTQQPSSASGDCDLLGMTISDAAVKVLTARRRVMGNAELLAEFKRGGLILTSADPLNVVNSVLARRHTQVSDIVRVDRGQWGLQQWYPGRSFKKKVGKVEDGEAIPAAPIVDPSAPVPPLEQPEIDPADLM